MFRIDDMAVVDATLAGNQARFVNHSCEVQGQRVSENDRKQKNREGMIGKNREARGGGRVKVKKIHLSSVFVFPYYSRPSLSDCLLYFYFLFYFIFCLAFKCSSLFYSPFIFVI